MDAFTDKQFTGNPAGVVLHAEELSVDEMQKIANELKLPESAFLLPTDHPNADFRVRYFTPTEEINFCGHATVGLSWLLATKYGWMEKADQLTFETNVGLIPVKWIKENDKLVQVSMRQISPTVKEFPLEKGIIADLVGINPSDIDDRYPIKLAHTGNWHLLVPVISRRAIDAADPKLKSLGNMNKDYQIATTHLFTYDTTDGLNLYTRGFGPGVGIDEDPVTGSANGALAGYLYMEQLVSRKEKHQLIIGQGHAIGRPGTLYVTITPNDDQPIIEVAGSAIISIEGTILL